MVSMANYLTNVHMLSFHHGIFVCFFTPFDDGKSKLFCHQNSSSVNVFVYDARCLNYFSNKAR